MKQIDTVLALLIVMVLFSCSESDISVSSQDNYEIVELPDGSVAFLNNNSSIEYDKVFDKRIVRQEGEVFFDVRKGESPFIVITELGEIRVLGTKFNVRAYNRELEVEVQEGTVELKINKFIKKVKRGQKAIFNESMTAVKIYKAEFKHKRWTSDLNKEFKKFGKEVNKSFKHIGRESKKIGIEVGAIVKDL